MPASSITCSSISAMPQRSIPVDDQKQVRDELVLPVSIGRLRLPCSVCELQRLVPAVNHRPVPQRECDERRQQVRRVHGDPLLRLLSRRRCSLVVASPSSLLSVSTSASPVHESNFFHLCLALVQNYGLTVLINLILLLHDVRGQRGHKRRIVEREDLNTNAVELLICFRLLMGPKEMI